MSLWGYSNNTTSGIPKYLTDAEKLDTSLSTRGYEKKTVKTDMHNTVRTSYETLVAIRGGSETGKGAAADIIDVRFSEANGSAITVGSNTNIVVTWDEEVRVTVGAGEPTLTVLAANLTSNTVTAALAATYASGNGTNRLTFALPTYVNAASYVIKSATIANNIAFQIADKNTTANVASDLVIPAALTGANSVSATLVGYMNQPVITGIAFDANTVAQGADANVDVTFDKSVIVTVGVGAPTISLLTANTSSNTVPTPTTATYAGGNNSTTLSFTFTADANAATYTLTSGAIANNIAVQIADADNTLVDAVLTIGAALTGANSSQGTITGV